MNIIEAKNRMINEINYLKNRIEYHHQREDQAMKSEVTEMFYQAIALFRSTFLEHSSVYLQCIDLEKEETTE